MPSACDAAVDFLLANLTPLRKTTIVDVGANPINVPPYDALLQKSACHVIGFEPQAEAFARLQKSKSANETYFPFAIGTGARQDLRIYRSSGMTSIFDPYLPGLRSVSMRRLGFGLHRMMFNVSRAMRNSQSDRLNKSLMADQLIDGDGVYLRNVAEPENLSDQQLMHLAILAATVFSSHSLVLYCLDLLDERKAVPKRLPAAYADLLPAEYQAGPAA